MNNNLIFKLNDIDESIIQENIYFCSCKIIDEKKYILSIIGKNYMKDQYNQYNIECKSSLAFWVYDDIIMVRQSLIPFIELSLNDGKNIFVNIDKKFIVDQNEIYISVPSNDFDAYKSNMLKRLNNLIDNYVSSISIKGFFKSILYIQKLVLDGKIEISYQSVDNSNVLEYINNEQFSETLRKEVGYFYNILPNNVIPTLADINFNLITDEDIDVLNIFIKNMQLLFEQFRELYVFVELIVNENDLEKLKELERKILKTYYMYMNIL